MRAVLKAGVFLSAIFVLVIRNFAITTYASGARRRAARRDAHAAGGFLWSFFLIALAYYFLEDPYAYSVLVIVGLLAGDVLGSISGDRGIRLPDRPFRQKPLQ